MRRLHMSNLIYLVAGVILWSHVHANLEGRATISDPADLYGNSFEELKMELYFDDSNNLEDWGVYNYTSDQRLARKCVVQWEGKTYDPLSFKGSVNDTFAIAFHLSTEVVVSAAQSRDGRFFDVARVDGSEAYKNLMAQIQQDLKGDRSSYYALRPTSSYNHRFLDLSLYKAYFRRLHKYLAGSRAPANITNPAPIFKEILVSIRNRTEEVLGAKMNTSNNYFSEDYMIYIYISAPWELNHTYSYAMRHAMKDLGMRIHYGGYELAAKPWTEWHDHTNDEKEYSGENGTALAFEQARKYVEMMEYDPFYRYGDFVCGTSAVEEDFRIEKEMKANGTWVEPPRKGVLEYECQNWRQCLTTWPWEWETQWEYW